VLKRPSRPGIKSPLEPLPRAAYDGRYAVMLYTTTMPS
jgi:hypothetical protein